MFSVLPIRRKLQLALGMLVLTLAVLSYSGIRSTFKYRGLVRVISQRSNELPLATTLAKEVSNMRVLLWQAIAPMDTSPYVTDKVEMDRLQFRQFFDGELYNALMTVEKYQTLLETNREIREFGWRPDSLESEARKLAEIRVVLEQIQKGREEGNDLCLMAIDPELETQLNQLQNDVAELPGFLQTRMTSLKNDVSSEYRTAFAVSTVCIIGSIGIIAALLAMLWKWVFGPLRQLMRGSRMVADGDFDHRIVLGSKDEMADLANAMNSMTNRFQVIENGLNQQVQERTKEVVRSEQLASVGFLAAGVAHEINNPLASIALCAESLEERLHDVFQEDDRLPDEQHNEEIGICRNYLRLIQDEAFRCKGITDGLLDFARIGDLRCESVNLSDAVRDVVEMVGHHGDYKEKEVVCEISQDVVAAVNIQEFKQVVLNLVTNGLDSLECGGNVTVRLAKVAKHAVLTVVDNGCGMTDEVKDHLFEPFFTRRADGKGTGLGMSITYRIVSEHGGTIQADSAGKGKGTTMTVRLPLTREDEKQEKSYQHQAA